LSRAAGLGFTSVTAVDSSIALVDGGGVSGRGAAAAGALVACIYFFALAMALAMIASLSEADMAPLALNSAFYRFFASILSFSTT